MVPVRLLDVPGMELSRDHGTGARTRRSLHLSGPLTPFAPSLSPDPGEHCTVLASNLCAAPCPGARTGAQPACTRAAQARRPHAARRAGDRALRARLRAAGALAAQHSRRAGTVQATLLGSARWSRHADTMDRLRAGH